MGSERGCVDEELRVEKRGKPGDEGAGAEGREESWEEIPDRTPSNARRNEVDPVEKAEARASFVGPRFCSRFRS